jgi:lipid II:glycine glycyltransferase (peptidoglycan interpeptide bridge formation enzyme)
LKTPLHRRAKREIELTDFLLAELKNRSNLISFCLHYKVDDLRSFQWFHYHKPEKGQFKINLCYTGLIDLKPFSNFGNYLKTIRKVRRYEYRQAIKNKLEIETSDDIDKLEYLHHLTFKRQGIRRSKTTSQKLRNITKAVLSKGFGELLLCKDNKKRDLSATLFLYDRRGGYYLIGANHPDYRKTGSGTFLFLENIKRCIKRRINLIDVCGINSPQRGDFKVSFNAKQTPYFVVTWKKPM